MLENIKQFDINVKSLTERIQDQEKTLRDINREIGTNPEETLYTLRNSIEEYEQQEKELINKVEKELRIEKSRLDGEQGKLKHILSEHTDLREKGLAICPKCGQKVNFEKM